MRKTCILVPLVVLLVTGCGLCGRLGPRRAVVEATPTAETVESEEGTPTPEPTPDAISLGQLLADSDWQMRMAAAHIVPGRHDVPLEDRVAMLADALEREVEAPSDEAQPEESYLPVSGIMQLRLTRSLGELGPDGIPVLRKLAEQAGGDVQACYLIALGYMGDREVAPKVRKVLGTSENAIVRMDAARVLGILGDREAIPVLQDALSDPYVTEGRSGRDIYRIYPVREQAAGALEALGMAVKRDGDTFTVSP